MELGTCFASCCSTVAPQRGLVAEGVAMALGE
jgi:hypothetical protein